MFTRARIQLTLFYTVTIMVIIGAFSLILFHYTAQTIRDGVEEDAPNTHKQAMIAEHTIEHFQTTLVFTDIFIIILAALLSYFLADKTLKPIRIALDAQERFSAHASHELRTPLAVMKTENEIFLRSLPYSVAESRLLAISNLEEVNRMTDMVEHLLLLARSKKVDMKREMVEVNLSQVIERTVERMKKNATAQGIVITTMVLPDIKVQGNEHLLEQAFFNLLRNALTYTEQGSITLGMIQAQASSVTVTVNDTGIGIARKDIGRVFEPFFKADSSRTVSSSGVGLGLAIVKDIIELHRGSVRLESEIDRGTKVIVILPTS